MTVNKLDEDQDPSKRKSPLPQVTGATQAGLAEDLNIEGKTHKGKISVIWPDRSISIYNESGEHIHAKDENMGMGEVKFSEGDLIEYTLELGDSNKDPIISILKARPLSSEEKSEEEKKRIQGILHQVEGEINLDKQVWGGLKEDSFPLLEEYFKKHPENNGFGITLEELKKMKEKIYVIQAKQKFIEVKENLAAKTNRHQTQEDIGYLIYFIDTHGEEVELGITRQSIDEMSMKNKEEFLAVAQVGEVTRKYSDADERKKSDEILEQKMEKANGMEEKMMVLNQTVGKEKIEEETPDEEIVITSETETFSMKLFDDTDHREINYKIGDKVHFVLDRKNSPKGEVQICMDKKDILLVSLR